MPILSIIVPFYQSDDTIDRCIASIVAQSFIDWELILIDDGSTDGGPKRAESWVAKDERISLVCQANKGRSAARNAGKNMAKGEWLAFCDADDYLLPNALKNLMNLAASEIDVIAGNYESLDHHVDESTAKDVVDAKDVLDAVIKSKEDLPIELASFFDERSCRTVWAKLYRREIASQCTFPRGIRVGEDAFFNIQAFSLAKTIAFTAQPVYYYDESIAGTVNSYSPGSGKLLMEYSKVARVAFSKLRDDGQCDVADELRFVGTEYRREMQRAALFAEDLDEAANDFSHLKDDPYAQNALLEHARHKPVLKRAFISMSVTMAKHGRLKTMFRIERIIGSCAKGVRRRQL